MAYFAKIDETGKVTQTTALADDIAITEAKGAAFLNKIFRTNDTWVQFFKTTLAEGNPRKRGAAIGFIYDAGRDAFIEESTFASWVLDEADCIYKPPTPAPDPQAVGDGTFRPYEWDEATQTWVLGSL